MSYPPPGGSFFPGQTPLQGAQRQQARPVSSAATSPVFIKAEQHPQIPPAHYPSYVSPHQHLQPQPFPGGPPAGNLPAPSSEPIPPRSAKCDFAIQGPSRNTQKQKSPVPPAATGDHMQSMRPTPSKQTKPAKARPKCENQSIDYQVLLLSLADEYFDAAHSQGTILAASRQEADIEQYHKLIATGLCCIEAVLRNWRLQPRTEALLRLRYARILYEETHNDLEAETALSKGIDLCERV
ncbi:hypothetical protein CISG_05992 [Coccidioides immitis RMSCC 3703]|uniref:Uncharacterized protein n=1 Tax=Coccidioides immitis RMSCC 3703 TaxID=454286 RepID=A0A0J8QY33_COCIT|nr:hypothetical protein CISG_05992 [Coccidioides immitis RMSCC 3703]